MTIRTWIVCMVMLHLSITWGHVLALSSNSSFFTNVYVYNNLLLNVIANWNILVMALAFNLLLLLWLVWTLVLLITMVVVDVLASILIIEITSTVSSLLLWLKSLISELGVVILPKRSLIIVLKIFLLISVTRRALLLAFSTMLKHIHLALLSYLRANTMVWLIEFKNFIFFGYWFLKSLSFRFIRVHFIFKSILSILLWICSDNYRLRLILYTFGFCIGFIVWRWHQIVLLFWPWVSLLVIWRIWVFIYWLKFAMVNFFYGNLRKWSDIGLILILRNMIWIIGLHIIIDFWFHFIFSLLILHIFNIINLLILIKLI